MCLYHTVVVLDPRHSHWGFKQARAELAAGLPALHQAQARTAAELQKGQEVRRVYVRCLPRPRSPSFLPSTNRHIHPSNRLWPPRPSRRRRRSGRGRAWRSRYDGRTRACTKEKSQALPSLTIPFHLPRQQPKQLEDVCAYQAEDMRKMEAAREERGDKRPGLERSIEDAEAGVARAEAQLRWLARVAGEGEAALLQAEAEEGEEAVPGVCEAFARRARAVQALGAATAERARLEARLAQGGDEDGEGGEEGEGEEEEMEMDAELAAGGRKLATMEAQVAIQKNALKASARVLARAAAEEGKGADGGEERAGLEDEGKDGDGLMEDDEEGGGRRGSTERKAVHFSDPPDNRAQAERCVLRVACCVLCSV